MQLRDVRSRSVYWQRQQDYFKLGSLQLQILKFGEIYESNFPLSNYLDHSFSDYFYTFECKVCQKQHELRTLQYYIEECQQNSWI